MPQQQGVATTRRRLRIELRRLREQADLQQGEVAKRLDWSASKLIRIENGSVGISVTDLRALIAHYDVPDGDVDRLVKMARATRERTWWSPYRHVLSPQLPDFIGYEADAARILHYHPAIVPALLQTEAYMRALLPAVMLTALTDDEYLELADVRQRRQREVLDRAAPAELVVVLDEATLRRVVGGPDVMRAQLVHIVELAGRRPQLSLAVLPFAAGPHIGMQGPFQIMEFSDDADGSIVFLENVFGEMVEGRPEQCKFLLEHFERMLAVSRRAEEATALLRAVAEDLS
jgi:transcriptional regulator with XRE-family HTH domain